ncbi:MAG: ATP-binding protein [Calditrichaeota bacterium]|nr:ATP-binding protein [Calditrichota bacterium]
MTYENIQVNRRIFAKLPASEERIIVLLTGARQTGKTTTVRYLYPDIAYHSLDSLELREQLDRISAVGWGKTVGNAVLDEVQKLPTLLEKVKYAFDAKEISFSVLTGSAQILLLRNIRETLAGRIFIYELWPLMLSELVGIDKRAKSEPFLSRMFEGNLDMLLENEAQTLLGEELENAHRAEEHLLMWGGMPALLHYNSDRRNEWLKSYEMAYLERDLGDLARLADLRPFRKLQQLAALRSANLLSFSELARDTGINVDTARRYIEYLRLSYQAYLLPPFSENLTSRLIKMPKLYWMDMGLWRSMTGIREIITGPCFETYVISEVIKYVKTTGLDIRLSYYRTRSGMEIDLILERGRTVWAIEIKSREQVVSSDTKQLQRLAQALGDRWGGGLVVYRGDHLLQLGEKLWAVPSHRLLS